MKTLVLILIGLSFNLAEARTTPWEKYEDRTDAILTVDQKTVMCDQANLRLIVKSTISLDPFNPRAITVPFSTAVDCYRMATHLFDRYSQIPIVLLETGETSHYYEPDCEPDMHHGCEHKVFRKNQEKYMLIENLKLPFSYDQRS